MFWNTPPGAIHAAKTPVYIYSLWEIPSIEAAQTSYQNVIEDCLICIFPLQVVCWSSSSGASLVPHTSYSCIERHTCEILTWCTRAELLQRWRVKEWACCSGAESEVILRSQCPCSPSCNQLIDYFLKSFYLTFIPKILQRFAINWHNVIAVWDHLSACSFKEWTWIHFKGIVHPKMKVLSSFTYPQVVVQNIFQEWW